MRLLSRLTNGIRAIFQRAGADEELDAELQAFLETAIDEKTRSGMSREEATRAARLELGLVSIESVKDRVRDVGWETYLESIWQDIRYALRTLRKAPVFTATAVFTLALGIGANTALFTIVDQVLLRLLPVHNPHELVLVASRGAYYGDTWGDGSELSYPTYAELRDRNQTFDGMFARFSSEVQGRVQDRTERVLAEYVTGRYCPVLGVNAALGRTINSGASIVGDLSAAGLIVNGNGRLVLRD